MGTGSDRLGEDEWLVRDGAAKVLFCALAWTLAQWSGCGRIKGKSPSERASKEASRLFDLLCKTVDPSSQGFKQFGKVGEPGEPGEKDYLGDQHGIISIIRGERLNVIAPPNNMPLIKVVHESYLANLAPAGACPETRFDEAFNQGLLFARFVSMCGYSPKEANGIKTWKRKRKSGAVRQQVELNEVFKAGAPIARVLIGSTESIERTTLDMYKEGASLNVVQDFPAETETASPIPLALLIRLARIFGFSPVSDEQATAEAIEEARTRMTEARRQVWEAWCGEPENVDTLRGSDWSDFATCFIAALEAGILGPLPGDAVKVVSPKNRNDRSTLKDGKTSAAAADTASSSISKRDTDVIVNAMSADPDKIGMTIDLQLDDGRIVLRSICYQLDTEVHDEAADLRLCLRRIVTRWNWGQSIWAKLEDADEAALLRSIDNANPGLKIGRVKTDTAVLQFDIVPVQAVEPLAPNPGVAVPRLTLPRAELVVDDSATHRFELWAYWSDVRLRQRQADGSYRLFDRADLREPLTEAESGKLVLREYSAQIELGFPTDGILHRIGFREARVQRQPLPVAASASA